MTEKEKRQQRAQAEDAVFNRMLLWLVLAMVAEAIVLFVKRFYIEFTTDELWLAIALSKIFPIFSCLGLVLTVLGIIWCVSSLKKNRSVFCPAISTAIVAFLWVLSVLVFLFHESGIRIMTFVPIAAVVLILIYFLYHKAFLLNSVITACGMLALWGVRHFSNSGLIVVFVIGWICLLGIAVLAWYVKRKGGKLGKIKLVTDPKSYAACFLSCAVVFVLTVLGLILGSGAAYYLLYVLIGWFFCLAVYYTVKMM